MKTTFICILCSLLIGTNMHAQNFDKESFETKSGKPVAVFFVKHASLILKYNDRLIYVDPVSGFMNADEQPKADIILITHEHYDHFDVNAINALKKENTKIISNIAVQDSLKEGVALKNGGKLYLHPNIEVEAVPAYNTTPGREMYHPKDRDNGYILTIEGLRIYIAGDTEDIPEMENIKNPDIAFLPVNQPYTMTVEQAVHAAKIIKPKLLYPYHYGETKVEEIKEILKTEAPEIEVIIKQMQ